MAVLLVLEHLLPQQQRVAAARLLAPRPLPLRLGLRRLCRPKTKRDRHRGVRAPHDDVTPFTPGEERAEASVPAVVFVGALAVAACGQLRRTFSWEWYSLPIFCAALNFAIPSCCARGSRDHGYACAITGNTGNTSLPPEGSSRQVWCQQLLSGRGPARPSTTASLPDSLISNAEQQCRAPYDAIRIPTPINRLAQNRGVQRKGRALAV